MASNSIGTHITRIKGRVYRGSTPPTGDVRNGELWVNSTDNLLNVYYNGVWYASGGLTTSTSTSSTSTSTSTTA